MEKFAALRFTEDENLRGRVYWYIAPFSVKEGERVLAPVGPHDFTEEEAPYPAVLCKHILAKLGEREAAEGVFDLGGVRYDDRHYTRLCRILIAEDGTRGHDLPVKRICTEEEWLLPAAEARDCVLLYGENVKEAASLILRIVRGEDPEGVPPSVLLALRGKLC